VNASRTNGSRTNSSRTNGSRTNGSRTNGPNGSRTNGSRAAGLRAGSRGASWQPPRHVVVTGAAGAIGGALALAMRQAWEDVELALVDRDANGLAAIAKQLDGGDGGTGGDGHARGDDRGRTRDDIGTACRGAVTTHVADLRDLESLPTLVGRIAEAGPIDGLINCAGVMRVQQLASWRWQDAWDLLALDLLAPLRLQDLVVREMVAAGAGTIVNVASMAGRVPLRGCAYYGAAKAGLAMASEIARADLGDRGVRVVTVYPGPVRSALEQGARDAYGGGGLLGRLAPTGDPAELAARIVAAIEGDEPRVIYPRLYGLGWVAPNFSRRVALEYGPPPVS
jgi:3-hydroxybutyrate dehydrogenase